MFGPFPGGSCAVQFPQATTLDCRNLVVAYGRFDCILEGLMWSNILLVIKQSYLKEDEGGYGAKEAMGLKE